MEKDYFKNYFRKNKETIYFNRDERNIKKVRNEIEEKKRKGLITPFAYNMLIKFRDD